MTDWYFCKICCRKRQGSVIPFCDSCGDEMISSDEAIDDLLTRILRLEGANRDD